MRRGPGTEHLEEWEVTLQREKLRLPFDVNLGSQGKGRLERKNLGQDMEASTSQGECSGRSACRRQSPGVSTRAARSAFATEQKVDTGTDKNTGSQGTKGRTVPQRPAWPLGHSYL